MLIFEVEVLEFESYEIAYYQYAKTSIEVQKYLMYRREIILQFTVQVYATEGI